ncbi:HpcH/HpaI aldolase/citrate lyase family protein [Falsirhodobacter halotolerans]|uniref:HpcH/HpaI aldolase/citrate lyase family protein n=1 Tax=Falsirhodobacter halotolerans TaxID=1146892 RepID=UPI001FD60FCF|nr:CoA ester lyase [Falsirhodobacter halotolerans]MCJ8139887.1 CoA ester lyase [Falsirhodobacter halotolerans]
MIRSLLYVPGNTPRFLEKAGQRGADAVIIDLEDAVPEAGKTAAREALAGSVPMVGGRVFVRVNMTERLFEDAAAAVRAGAEALYLPKVRGVDVLHDLDAHLTPLEGGRPSIAFVPLIEDAEGLFEARSIAKGPRVLGLSAGGEDLATSMGARPTAEVLRMPKLMIHYAAKAAGVLSFGMFRSTVDYTDPVAIRDAAREARDFGFDGASCIHPAVVPILNEGFAPTPEEVAWARRVVAANAAQAAAGRGAFTLDGKFIDAPIVTRAERLLSVTGRPSDV